MIEATDLQKVQELETKIRTLQTKDYQADTQDERLDEWIDYLDIYDTAFDMWQRNPSIPKPPEPEFRDKEEEKHIRGLIFLKRIEESKNVTELQNIMKEINTQKLVESKK